jgi:hypothetical protein
MAIRWKLEPALKRAGIENAHQLAERAGLGYPAAVRIFAHMEAKDALGRFDMRTLNTLARLFRVKPWALLEHTPD